MKNKIYKITSLEKKRKNYLICFNEKEYKVSEDMIIKYGLLKDREFSLSEFDNILIEVNKNVLFNKAINYLGYKSCSVKEIKDYLIKKEARVEDIDDIINKIMSFGYLDDKVTSISVVRYYMKSKGPKYIQKILYKRGFKKEDSDNALLIYKEEDEIALIRKIIDKKQDVTYPINKQKKSIYTHLITNGFSSNLIQEQISLTKFIDDSFERGVREYEKLLKRHSNKENSNQKIYNSLYLKGYSTDTIKKIMNNKK